MQISDEFWDEFIDVSRAFVAHKHKAGRRDGRCAIPRCNQALDYEFTVYDVFEYIRLYRLDGLPYSENFLKRIDGEIEREIARGTI